jgi:hypothetical protein
MWRLAGEIVLYAIGLGTIGLIVAIAIALIRIKPEGDSS